MSKEPRFVYRPDHPHGPNILDRETGRWISVELFQEMAAALPANLKAEATAGVWVNPEIEHIAEDADALHLCLDNAGIPRDADGKMLSLWGRVLRYAEQVKNAEQPASAALRCPKCGNGQTIKFSYATVPQSAHPVPPDQQAKDAARYREALELIANTDPDEGTAWFHDVADAALSATKQEEV